MLYCSVFWYADDTLSYYSDTPDYTGLVRTWIQLNFHTFSKLLTGGVSGQLSLRPQTKQESSSSSLVWAMVWWLSVADWEVLCMHAALRVQLSVDLGNERMTAWLTAVQLICANQLLLPRSHIDERSD